jgi:hypothetical protein
MPERHYEFINQQERWRWYFNGTEMTSGFGIQGMAAGRPVSEIQRQFRDGRHQATDEPIDLDLHH